MALPPLKSCMASAHLLICLTRTALLIGKQLVRAAAAAAAAEAAAAESSSPPANLPLKLLLNPHLRAPRKAALNRHKKAGLSQGPA